MLDRRRFISWLAGAPLSAALADGRVRSTSHSGNGAGESASREHHAGEVTLFLCGDVMTGRGIDQILPHRNEPEIHEPYLTDARDYVALAERRNGPIPSPAGFDYVWGEALEELERVMPDARIINLETAITTHHRYEPKGINYRMHPGNVPLLTAAKIDCCALANNHVLDWSEQGLHDTLAALHDAGIRSAGAGRDFEQAQAAAVIPTRGQGRVLVYAFGSEYSGIDRSWAAGRMRAGINLLADMSDDTVDRIAARVGRDKAAGDIVVASIHWGGNWGYEIPAAQRQFAHRLIRRAGIDLVHGHSSHHVKGIEVYRDRLIIYGCGDFLNDYEGIRGYTDFRPDLGLMYFPTLQQATGRLLRLRAVPTRIRRFRIERASQQEASWLVQVLDREGGALGTRVAHVDQHGISLAWHNSPVAG